MDLLCESNEEASFNECLAVVKEILPECFNETMLRTTDQNRQEKKDLPSDRCSKNLLAQTISTSNFFTQSLKNEEQFFENSDSFFVVLREKDLYVLYASEQRFRQLCLKGKPLTNFCHCEDVEKIRHYLSRKKSNIAPKGYSAGHYPKVGKKIFFHFRMTGEANNFNHVSLAGVYKKNPEALVAYAEHDYTFFGIIQPIRDRPILDLSLLESIQDQYITRHALDGKKYGFLLNIS